MSLRSRARHLQRTARIGYQDAVAKLRALGERPALLARQNGWPLSRCDVYCVDPALDAEWRAAHASGAAVEERRCSGCGTVHFVPGGWPGDSRCAACGGFRQSRGSAIQPVLSASPSSPREVCERLVARACGRAAIWLPRRGPAVTAGQIDEDIRAWLVAAGLAAAHGPDGSLARAADAAGFYLHLVEPLGALVIVPLAIGSVGLMRLAARQAESELRHLLSALPPFVPPSPTGGPSGAPSSAAAGLAWPTFGPRPPAKQVN